MSVSNNVVFTFTFYDQNGNYLPQFDINGVLTQNDYNTLLGTIQNQYVQALKQIGVTIKGYTSSNPTGTVSSIDSQVVSAMNQIATLSPNAGFGTTETSSFSGAIAGQNVQFTITANNFPTSTLIMSWTDFQQLQQNPQSGVSVINPISTTLAPTISYQQLENQLISAGVQQYVSPGTLTQASTGTVKSYSVIVQSYNGTQQTFILSSSDYINLYTTQLSSLISANVSSSTPNATFSQVLQFISSGSPTVPSTTTPVSNPPLSTNPTISQGTTVPPSTSTTPSAPVIQTITINGTAMPVKTPDGSPAVYTVVTKNSDGTVNLLITYGGVTQTYQFVSIPNVMSLEQNGATVNDPNGLLTAPAPTPGNVTVPGNLNQNPTTQTGTQTLPTDPITQQNLNTIIEQSATQNPVSATGGKRFNKNSFFSDPIGIAVAAFVGVTGLSLAMPRISMPKHLKRKRGNKK